MEVAHSWDLIYSDYFALNKSHPFYLFIYLFVTVSASPKVTPLSRVNLQQQSAEDNIYIKVAIAGQLRNIDWLWPGQMRAGKGRG